MATETVKDYLDQPCHVAKASAFFDEMMDEARSKTKLDRREVARQIGRRLNDLSAQLEHLQTTPEAVLDLLPNDTDSDAARAVLEMAKPYAITICNKFAELAGYALLALELGGLTQAQSAEVSHG